jgi:hypothetical protein
MGKDSYRFQALDKQRQEARRVNPIWRGVGCITISVFGAAGYLFAQWFIRANAVNGWLYLPPQAYNPNFPSWLNFIEPFFYNGTLIKLVVAFLFIIISFGILNFLYAIGFPWRPTDEDAGPPNKRLAKRQRREDMRAKKERRKYRH